MRRIETRRLLVLFVCLLVTQLLCQGAAADAKRPNIVFIFSDDHALQAIGAYGSTINETPNIDRIAREGATFTNSFCANSICGPSRALHLDRQTQPSKWFLAKRKSL